MGGTTYDGIPPILVLSCGQAGFWAEKLEMLALRETSEKIYQNNLFDVLEIGDKHIEGARERCRERGMSLAFEEDPEAIERGKTLRLEFMHLLLSKKPEKNAQARLRAAAMSLLQKGQTKIATYEFNIMTYNLHQFSTVTVKKPNILQWTTDMLGSNGPLGRTRIVLYKDNLEGMKHIQKNMTEHAKTAQQLRNAL